MFDPNQPQGGAKSPMHDMVRERFSQLSPEDQQVLDSVSPEQAGVIVKLFPELRDVLMEMMEPDAGMEAEGPEEPAEAEEDEGAPFAPQRPRTSLGQV